MLGSLPCWAFNDFSSSATQPPSPTVHGNASPFGSQSERNSSRLNPRTCPIMPARSLDLCSIRACRSTGFRLVPSPKRQALPAKDRISEPSETISDTHRNNLRSMSTRSIVCCFVILAWSVQFKDLIGPRTFLWALFPPSCANPSRVIAGQAC